MKLCCPYCTNEISPETEQCPSCCTEYGRDTRELVRIIFEKADQEYENERRRQIRIQKTFKASYSSPKHFAESYIHDLSLGGVFVVTDDPLEPEEKLDLKIFLPDKTAPIEVPCEVTWFLAIGGQRKIGAGQPLTLKRFIYSEEEEEGKVKIRSY